MIDNTLRNNLPFVIILILLILVLVLLVYTYQRKKIFKKDLNNLKKELLLYQEYDNNFDEELNDGTKIKSGSEIQMKNKSGKLIAISFNKKTKKIKYMDDVEKEAHINLFKKYESGISTYFMKKIIK